jgi:phosphoserine phosphatase RsbU/P
VVAIVEADLSMSQVLDALIHFVIVIVAIIFFGVSLSVLLLLWVVSRSVTRPINRLTVGVAQVDGGNLDPAFEIHTGDEIEDLANAFVKMTDKIKDYIINLAAETAIRERISSELAVAAQIQRDILPNVFPANSSFDIYAEMHAAREVGGDFYDFFLIGEDKLAFVVADVSGKGIPAAFFMMMAKTIIKTNALSGYPVNEVLARANNTLYENNETSMFVTAFLGILDFNTGVLSFANAGHNPPMIRNTQGNYEWLLVKHGFVLAGLQNVKYTRQEIQLARSQRIFCYTDGVTEAVNGNQELYSDQRLIDTLNLNKDLPTIANLIGSVKKAIDAFTVGVEQADDITLLAVEFKTNSTQGKRNGE